MSVIRIVHGLRFFHRLLVRRVLILGDAALTGACAVRLHGCRGRTFEQVISPPAVISPEHLARLRIWAVVVLSGLDSPTADALLECKLRGFTVIGGAAFHEHYLGRLELDYLTRDALVLSDGFAGGRAGTALKRGTDVALSILMLILSLPVMAAAALAIGLDSPGPIFYRQQRTGQFGRGFTVFKFRSMATDAEACGKPRWAQAGDPRITRVGRFIRASRIDELPQLINIIRGDMSLVGPRPERPHFVTQLASAIPFYSCRACVKPGLTGWAQVNYPYGASVEDAREKLAYDLYYVKHRTVWLDLVILLSTIRVVLFREGAR